MRAEIALNGLLLDRPFSGTATYIYNLVRLLPSAAPDLRFRLYLRNARFAAEGVEVRRLTTPMAALNRGRGVGARLDKLSWEVVAWPLVGAIRHDALLHSLYFATPLVKPAPTVVTIHDLVPLVVPGYHRGRQSSLYASLMAAAVKRADAIITVSEHSKGDIVRVLGIPPDRVHVTHEAADERFSPGPASEEVTSKYRLPQRFVLYMGGAECRKNLETLVRAWARAARTMQKREIKLVLVADFPPPDDLYPDIPALVGELGLSRDVLIVPRVDEEDKPHLYRCAVAFCFPSLYEGFGLPPLEAMASGTPTLTSNATSIPEVVGDAAILLDPLDPAAWSEAMTHVVESDSAQAELRRRGIERSGRFRWMGTAEGTVRVYREVLGQ